MGPFVILGVSGLFCRLYSIFNGKILLSNTVDPDQMPHNVASDLCLHYLPMPLLRVSRKNRLRFSWCPLYIFQTIIEVGV